MRHQMRAQKFCSVVQSLHRTAWTSGAQRSAVFSVAKRTPVQSATALESPSEIKYDQSRSSEQKTTKNVRYSAGDTTGIKVQGEKKPSAPGEHLATDNRRGERIALVIATERIGKGGVSVWAEREFEANGQFALSK
ncbi:hypothetical protein R1flu_021547 [Riccia fluitans]|uniref:Uncharacterized protein n=1 Tax=Riccia fluitans TaxID=41844 RepID=A0ABD1ZSU6_9MARC